MNAPSTPPVRHPLQCCSQTVCDNMFGDYMAVAQTAKLMKCLEGLVLKDFMNSLLPTLDSHQQLYKTDDIIRITLHALQHHPDQQGTNACLFFVYSSVIPSRLSYKKSYLCLWIQDFKSGKTDLHCSSNLSVSTGVPQDSVWSAHNLQHTCFIYCSIIKLSQTNVILKDY